MQTCCGDHDARIMASSDCIVSVNAQPTTKKPTSYDEFIIDGLVAMFNARNSELAELQAYSTQ